jgi:hypothetical protein
VKKQLIKYINLSGVLFLFLFTHCKKENNSPATPPNNAAFRKIKTQRSVQTNYTTYTVSITNTTYFYDLNDKLISYINSDSTYVNTNPNNIIVQTLTVGVIYNNIDRISQYNYSDGRVENMVYDNSGKLIYDITIDIANTDTLFFSWNGSKCIATRRLPYFKDTYLTNGDVDVDFLCNNCAERIEYVYGQTYDYRYSSFSKYLPLQPLGKQLQSTIEYTDTDRPWLRYNYYYEYNEVGQPVKVSKIDPTAYSGYGFVTYISYY